MHHSVIGFIGLISKLENEHFELGRVFACSTLTSLADCFSVFDDIGLAVGHEVLFLESFDEILERGKGLDVPIGVDVPNLGYTAELCYCKTGLLAVRNFGELYIFFNTECPCHDGRDRGVLPIEVLWFRNIHRHR